jgi:hypothetical protein
MGRAKQPYQTNGISHYQNPCDMKTLERILESIKKTAAPGAVIVVALLVFSLTLTEEHRFTTANKIIDLLLGNAWLLCIIIVEAVIIWHMTTKPKDLIDLLTFEKDQLVEENKQLKETLKTLQEQKENR